MAQTNSLHLTGSITTKVLTQDTFGLSQKQVGTLGLYGAGPKYGCTLVKAKILHINVYVQ